MNRRTRTLFVVGIAVVLAALAAFGVLRVLQNRPVVQVQVAERHIIVAALEIPAGTMITPDMVRLQAWPAESLVPGAFTTPEEVVNRGATSDILANEPITEVKLAAAGSGAGMQTIIPPGMRAVAVRVNDVIGVAGFAGPGTHVDVVVTANPGKEFMSRVVVSNVEVLSAGTQLDRTQTREGNATPASVVTLLVTPPDAERLALAQNQGQIALALRNPLDVDLVETKGIRMSALIGEPDPPPVPVRTGGVRRVVAPPPPPPDPDYKVEMLRGPKREEVIIK
jgi:pilus assembly protein CpaB